MILESIVTTRNADGSINLAPMGPSCFDPQMQRFELRPFKSSQTFRNLQSRRCGVLHVTDDVILFAQAVTSALPDELPLVEATHVDCQALVDVCRYYEFEVAHFDLSNERCAIQCKTLARTRIRDFFGFNRAKHAVIEACILATRLGFVPFDEISCQLLQIKKQVDKTGGAAEQAALQLLQTFVSNYEMGSSPSSIAGQ